jgi:protease I
MTPTAGPLSGRTVGFLCATEGAEQVELTEPWRAVEEAGGTPVLISDAPGAIQAFHHLDRGDRFDVDAVVSEVRVDDYDGFVLPGGVASPDLLRTVPNVVRVLAEAFAGGTPVAAICHAPCLLIEVDGVRGRRLTSFPSLATDLRNAGAHWVDEEVVVDHGLVTSRSPEDLPAFCRALVEQMARPRQVAVQVAEVR